MGKQQSTRFTFTIAEGPNAGLTTGAFKLWTRKEDTYLAPVELGGIWKLSLHADSVWRWAITKEHMTAPDPIVPGPGRMAFDYEPVEFDGGRRLAFTICTFRHALLPRELDKKALHVRVNDSWQEVTLAGIWMTEPGVELERSRPVGEPLILDSGRRGVGLGVDGGGPRWGAGAASRLVLDRVCDARQARSARSRRVPPRCPRRPRLNSTSPPGTPVRSPIASRAMGPLGRDR